MAEVSSSRRSSGGKSGGKTSRQKERIESAHAYLAVHVDPVMSRMVTTLMIEQPEEVALAMVQYLRKLSAGEPASPLPTGSSSGRVAQRKDRVYMAKEVSPILMKLMNRLIVARPTDVIEFLIAQLEEMLGMSQDESDAMSIKLQTSIAKLDDGLLTARSYQSLPSLRKPESFGLAEDEKPSEAPAPNQDSSLVQEKSPEQEAVMPSLKKVPQAVQIMVILVIGIDGAGKTTLMETLQGNMDSETKPSHGFKHITMLLSEYLKVKFYDLGGNPKIRGIWSNYYHDVHGIIYMMDGSSPQRYEEATTEYRNAVNHKYLKGKPCLVLVNKEDQSCFKSPDEISADIGLEDGKGGRISGIIARGANSGGCQDTRMDGEIEWLVNQVQENWELLNDRVKADTKDMQDEFERQRFEKNKKVFRGLLEQAFPQEEGKERVNCMEEEDGLICLAAEIGADVSDLPEIAAEIGRLCGFQTLALQMIGGMKVPVGKNNRPWEWNEILDYVNERRVEVNLN